MPFDHHAQTAEDKGFGFAFDFGIEDGYFLGGIYAR